MKYIIIATNQDVTADQIMRALDSREAFEGMKRGKFEDVYFGIQSMSKDLADTSKDGPNVEWINLFTDTKEEL